MRFLHGKVKARKGQIIQVNFSEPTRVLVMTPRNFEKYKNNLTFTYYGGHKEQSPYEFKVPQYGEWYVVVEKGTYYEPLSITASINVLPGEEPEPPKPRESEGGETDSEEETTTEPEDEEVKTND